MSWSLTVNGVAKSLSAWRITDLVLHLNSGAADTLSFSRHQAFDTADVFPYGATIVLTKNGTTRFRGRIRTLPRTGSAASAFAKAVQYTAEGPWADLERIVFEQYWKKENGEIASTIVVLGKTMGGNRMTCGDQIKEIIQHAKTHGALLSPGSGLGSLSITPPESEETDVTCAEAISSMLRWHKDVVTWFDYTQPVPVLNFTARSASPAVTVGLTADASGLTITERKDISPRGVVINYSISSSVNGKITNRQIKDTAGATTGIDVIRNTIHLEGQSVTKLMQEIKSTSVPTIPIAIENYLRSGVSWLYSSKIQSITWSDQKVEHTGGELITDPESGEVSEKPPVALPYILKSGACQDWMKKKTGTCLISAKAAITYSDRPPKYILISMNETTTDASSKIYEKISDIQPGEILPKQLASKIFAQFSTPHYEGQITIVLPNISGLYRPGQVVNFSQGLPAWTGIRAQIQQVTEQPGDTTDTVTVTFGPPSHLSSSDFVELIRSNRVRKPAESSDERATGDAENSASIVNLSGRGPNTDTKLLDEGGMPPLGETDSEFMVMQIRLITPEPTPENPTPAPEKTPVWDWVRLVGAAEQ